MLSDSVIFASSAHRFVSFRFISACSAIRFSLTCMLIMLTNTFLAVSVGFNYFGIKHATENARNVIVDIIRKTKNKIGLHDVISYRMGHVSLYSGRECMAKYRGPLFPLVTVSLLSEYVCPKH